MFPERDVHHDEHDNYRGGREETNIESGLETEVPGRSWMWVRTDDAAEEDREDTSEHDVFGLGWHADEVGDGESYDCGKRMNGVARG